MNEIKSRRGHKGSLTATIALGIAALVGIVFDASPSFAITLQTSAGLPGNQSYSGVGVQFIVNAPITVTALGIYDSGQDGIAAPASAPLTVDLMTNGGAIEASETFDVDAQGTLDPASGGYRFDSITPVTLAPGDYILVGYGWTGADQEYNCNLNNRQSCDVFNNGGGLLTYVNSPYGGGGDSPGTVPTTTLGDTNFFSAANMQYTAASAVPEPGSLAILGASLAGFGLLRRRRRTR